MGEPLPEGRDHPVASDRADKAAAILEDLDAVERGLDPRPARRGQLIADAVAVATIAAAVVVMDFPVERPAVLVALLLAAAGATRLIRRLLSRQLRNERERLLDGLDP